MISATPQMAGKSSACLKTSHEMPTINANPLPVATICDDPGRETPSQAFRAGVPMTSDRIAIISASQAFIIFEITNRPKARSVALSMGKILTGFRFLTQ